MSKYIDSEKLIAEIDNILAKAEKAEKTALRKKDAPGHLIATTKTLVCAKINRIIKAIQQEQSEVNIVTEYDEQFYADPVYGKLVNRNAGIGIARHFYELGLNTRKEETKK